MIKCLIMRYLRRHCLIPMRVSVLIMQELHTDSYLSRLAAFIDVLSQKIAVSMRDVIPANRTSFVKYLNYLTKKLIIMIMTVTAMDVWMRCVSGLCASPILPDICAPQALK